jgi:chromosome segregation ATPase
MLEEKDRHIQDLTETLNQFHDDQQKYFDDTTLNSTEQVTQMSADLNRAEATNRILRTQLDALKRQITNISQREKQARDMMKTLKTQLIRRPVISVKADKKLTNTNREEQLQRKIHQLENEILDLKDELRKQININDNKKAKNAAELGLWDKQKRFQELSEKLRAKLTEKEIDFERLKANYTAAKNTITRFEKEKHILENRIKSGRYYAGNNFCANCNHQHLTKYTPAETPDSYTGTGTASEISSVGDLALNEGGHEMLNILKARVESQQRKIVALELEGKVNTHLIL